MTDPTPEHFRALVRERFGFLEAHGFRRSPADEGVTPVGISVAYAGTHVGFLITYDVPDAAVDLRVVRVRDGRFAPADAGGYSRNLVAYLVEHAGYRGGVPRSGGPAAGAVDPVEERLRGWAELLREKGGHLIADRAEALPGD